MELYLKENNFVAGLKYLFRAASEGYKKAYGEIGIILYREKNEIGSAEEWFMKAEKSDALFSEAAYHYGMLLIYSLKFRCYWPLSRYPERPLNFHKTKC